MADTRSISAATTASRKAKGKKPAGPVDIGKELQQAISNIEFKQAGDREQDQEIEREVKKTFRETTNELKSYHVVDKKIDVLLEKYRDLLGNMKRLERDYKSTKKRADQTQKERDVAKSELHKMNTKHDKLESLAKTFQKSSRDMKQMYDSEQKKRVLLHEQVEVLVQDVEKFIDDQEKAKATAQTTDTDELFKQKFKSFIEQYELRELHFRSILRQRELERNYHMAKLDEHRKAQEAESSKSTQLTRQVSTFSQTEMELRSQLNVYVEKFKQVEDTLNSSNDLFLTFRKEMEEMSKKTKRLEKENSHISRKHDATNQNIIKMAEERTRMAADLDAMRKRNETLEKLCRRMQAQNRPAPPVAGAGKQPLMLRGQRKMEAGATESEEDFSEGEEGTEEEEEDDDDDDDDDDDGGLGANGLVTGKQVVSVEDGYLEKRNRALKSNGIKT